MLQQVIHLPLDFGGLDGSAGSVPLSLELYLQGHPKDPPELNVRMSSEH